MYGLCKQSFLTQSPSINLSSDNIKCCFITSGYTVNLATHQYVTDLSNILVRSGNFASKTETGGVFNAANITFTAVTGAQILYIVIYKDTGTDSTSPLILYIDTATNLPITPNGSDITITWDTGANKIFAL